MKKLMMILAFSAAPAFSAQIQISGTVLPKQPTCIVQSSHTSLQLISTPVSQMNGEQDYGSSHSSHLALTTLDTRTGKPCDNNGTSPIFFRFEGVTVGKNGVLANHLTGDSAAKGVGVALYVPGAYTPVPANGGTLNVAFGGINVDMVRLDGVSPEPGDVEASLTIDVEHL